MQVAFEFEQMPKLELAYLRDTILRDIREFQSQRVCRRLASMRWWLHLNHAFWCAAALLLRSDDELCPSA